MTKHTPGPWGHKPSHGKSYLDPVHRDGFEAVSSGRDFFEVYVSGRDRGERLANAALIASAPELLEALEKIAFSDGSLHGTCVRDLQDIARTAIAKARGE